MDRRIIALAAVLAAFPGLAGATAASPGQAWSYLDLWRPAPNALERLMVADTQAARSADTQNAAQQTPRTHPRRQAR